MSWSLCLDTSSRCSCLALAAADGQQYSTQLQARDSHDEELAVQVKVLLQDARVTPAEIGEVIVGAGPGSFTGLKIGFSFAKGLAWARRVPFYSYCSFSAAAFGLVGSARLIAVVADARGGELFLALFRGDLERFLPPLAPTSTVAAAKVNNDLLELCQSEGLGSDDLRIVCIDQPEQAVVSFRQELCPNLALGLWQLHNYVLNQRGAKRCFDLKQLVEEKPLYVRKVAAMTIAERAAARQ